MTKLRLGNLHLRRQCWEPPDVGLAPTGVWRVPPHPPLQLEDPFPQAKSPSLPALSLPLLGSFCNAPGVRDAGRPSLVGGGVLGGVEGDGPPAVLGARPTSGGTRQCRCRTTEGRFSMPKKWSWLRYFRNPCDRDPPTRNFKNFKFFENSLKYLTFTFGERASTFGERASTFGDNQGVYFWG